MTSEELTELLEGLHRHQSEGARVEAKSAQGGLPRRLWKTLSAFANSPDGGVALLGVDESRDFEPVGVPNPAKLQADLASLCDQMVPPLRRLIQLMEYQGRPLIVAELPVQEKCCYYSGSGLHNGAFLRVAGRSPALSQHPLGAFLSRASRSMSTLA